MGVKSTESGTKQRDVTELVQCWPVIGADQWPEPRDRTNLAPRTVRANLTSAAPPAAQMYGENEDSYVQSYIQTEHGAACETTLQLL